MDFNLSALLAAATGNSNPLTPSVTLPNPLPPVLAGSSTAQSLTLTVLNATAGNGVTTLQLPDGTTLTAKLNPPLPAGAQLQLTLTATQLATANQGSTTLTVPLRLLPPPPAPGTPTPTPAPLAPLTLTLAPTTTATAGTATAATAQLTSPSLVPPGPVLITPTPPPGSNAQALVIPPAPLPPGQPVVATVLPPTPQTLAAGTTRLALPTTPGQPPQILTLTTGTPLPTGSQVTLLPLAPTPNAPANSPQPALLLTATPPENPAPLPTASSPPSTLPPTTATLPSTAVVTVPPEVTLPNLTATLPARVLPALPLPAGSPPTTPLTQPILLPDGTQLELTTPTPLPAGSIVQVQFNNQNPPVLTGLQTPPTQVPAAPVTTTAPPLPTAPVTNSLTLPTGTQLTGVITSPASPTGAGTQQQLTLTITTPGPFQGQTLPLQVADVTAAATLPQGTEVSLQLTAAGHASVTGTTLPPAWATTQALVNLSQQWPALQQASQQATSLAPSIAQHLTARLPLLAAFLPGFMPYAAAVQQNQPAKAFGADALAFAKAMGLDLSSDVQQLHTLQQPPAQSGQPADTWRGMLFPYQEQPGSPPQQGRFFWRQQKQDQADDDAAKTTNTRFVVELNLTQLGPVQLDGLISNQALYMRLRLQQPLPTDGSASDFTSSLQQVVQSTLTKSGLEGGLAVEHTPTFPVDPTAELLASADATRTTLA